MVQGSSRSSDGARPNPVSCACSEYFPASPNRGQGQGQGQGTGHDSRQGWRGGGTGEGEWEGEGRGGEDCFETALGAGSR